MTKSYINGVLVTLTAQQIIDKFPILPFAQKQAQKMKDLQSRCEKAEYSGISATLPVHGNIPVLTDPKSVARLTAGMLMVQQNNGYQPKIIKNGASIRIKKIDFEMMFSAVAAHGDAVLENNAILFDQIAAAIDDAGLDAVDIETGWPA